MALEIPATLYFAQMNHHAHQQVSLKSLLKPFGLTFEDPESDHFLLIGHILDEIADHTGMLGPVDPIDVASAAWELGYEPARIFLESGPYMICRAWLEEQDLSTINMK